MALQKEIWINSIIENLFADNTFAARSVNHSSFVKEKTVHVPNAGSAPSVTKGRSSFPASVSTRTDNDLTYTIAEYTTDPFRIPNAEEVELSYDKRESIIRGCRNALAEAVHNDLVKAWVPASGYTKVATTGSAATAYAPSATGNRKNVAIADILSVKTEFDKENLPQTGRCILIDPVMYGQLLKDLTDSQANAFLACADATRGTIGNLFGFDFYMRSTVLTTVSAGTSLSSSADATDTAAALAWHEDYVSRALGNTELVADPKNPLYYGDIASCLVRAGGSYVNYGKKGIVLLYQATSA